MFIIVYIIYLVHCYLQLLKLVPIHQAYVPTYIIRIGIAQVHKIEHISYYNFLRIIIAL